MMIDTEKFTFAERNRVLEFLYETKFGSMTLELLTKPFLSEIGGQFLDSAASKYLITPFVKHYNIDKSEFADREYLSFNDFFTRELLPGKREIDMDRDHVISPCDGFLSVYDIDDDASFFIKNSYYSVKSLTHSAKAAEMYKGGYCAVIRLTPADYHRYIYLDNCKKGENRFIRGVLHTVHPVATETKRVYTENSRELTVLDTENFGKVTQIEVGALLVGRIENHHEKGAFERGEEKGMFLYGGSTIVLLFEKDKVKFDPEILEFTDEGFEMEVKLGEMIGEKA